MRITVSIFLFALCIILLPNAVHAQDDEPDTAFLLVPSESGARGDLSASGNRGNLVFPVRFDIPPSRGDTAPSVELIYDSADRAHGSWVGNGWSLDLGYIERSLEDGAPTYTTNADTFVLRLGKASGELVFVGASGGVREYRMDEENLFLRVFFDEATQVWTAFDKKGVEYTFGRGGFSRISTATQTFRWALDLIENPQFDHTTSITYQFFTPAGYIFPERINYFHGKVEFIVEDHPQPFTTHRYGFPFTTTVDKILTSVETYYRSESGTFERAAVYEIDYTSTNCAVNVDSEVDCMAPTIGQITRFNGDMTDSLPPTIFTYADPSQDAALASTPLWAFPLVSGAGLTESDGTGDNGVRMADLNNDGYPDIVQADGDNQRNTYVNNHVNGWGQIAGWQFPVLFDGGFTEDDGTGDNGVRLVDIDNDGFADIVVADGDSQRRTMLNNQLDDWVVTGDWQIPLIAGAGFTEDGGSGDNGVRLVDVNNDDFVDIVQADGDSQRETLINNQTDGWDVTTDWQIPLIAGAGFTEDGGSGDNGVRFEDVNGDGWVDIVQADGDNQRSTFLNNQTNGWDSSSDWQVPVIGNGGFTEDDGTGDNGLRLADINNDGFADLVQADGDTQRRTLVNNQTDGWDDSTAWTVPVIEGGGFTESDGSGDNGVRLVDVDRDGWLDLVQADGDDPNQHVTYLNDGASRWQLVTEPPNPLQLEYNWQLSTSWELPVMDRGGFTEEDGGGNNGASFVDVNADGYVDIVQADGNEGSQHITFLNNGVDGWEGTSAWQFPFLEGGFTETDGGGDNGVRLADVNGDGYIDILQADGDDLEQHRTYVNNTVDGWTLSADWVVPLIESGDPFTDIAGFTEADGNGDNGVRIADVNGDGFDDIVQADDADQRLTLLNDGVAGWTPTDEWQIPEIDNGGFTEDNGEGDNGVRMVDVNGDGLVDVVQADGDAQRETFLNNGVDGWDATSDWEIPVMSGAGFTEDAGDGDNGVRMQDLNFDGFVDILHADGDSQRRVYLNNGVDGWDEVKSWHMPILDDGGFTEDGGEGDNGVRMVDVNGDGFVDIVQADGEQRRTYLNRITMPPLLSRVDNGIGGVSDIAFAAHTGRPVHYTVDAIADTDGFASTSASYEFAGPFFDEEEQEFRGYHMVRAVSNRRIVETYYHQGNDDDLATYETNDHVTKRGRAYFVRILKPEHPDLLYQAQRNRWERRMLSPGSFVFLEREVIYDFDVDGRTSTAKASAYEYDEFGNVARTEKFNYVTDVALDGIFVDNLSADNIVTNVEYALDDPADPKVRALPARVTAEDVDGRILKERRYFYDDLDFGDVMLGRLTEEHGLRLYDDVFNHPTEFITETDASLPDSVPVIVELATYDYDSDGNVTMRTNALGDDKSYRYDPTNLYVVAEVVRVSKGKVTPVNVFTTFDYHRHSGQISHKTAPNGALYEWQFDDFGRLLATLESDSANPGTLDVKEQYTYALGGVNGSVSNNRIEKLSVSGTVQEQNIAYLDGYLRTIQTKALRELNGSPVFATQDTRYNDLGQVDTASQLYFSPTSAFTFADEDRPHVRSEYDGLGRLVATVLVNMDSADSPVSGERMAFIVRGDQQGKVLRRGDQERQYLLNANGQITEVVEKNGTEQYHTRYTYDLLDRLVKTEDDHGNDIALRYDSLDRKREMLDPDTGLSRYVYDRAGNVTEYVDANNITTLFSYDELFRLLSKEYPQDASATVTYVYDENGDTGFLTTIESEAVLSKIDYDVLGRVVDHDREIDNGTYSLSTTYDNVGRVLSLTYPDDDVVQYEYFDNGGQLARVLLNANVVANFTEYGAHGRALAFSFANGTATSNEYYPGQLRLMGSTVLDAGNTELQGLAFRYNEYGNVLSIRNRVAETTKRFDYDDLNRLTQFSFQGDQDPAPQIDAYAYDAIGNILEKEGSVFTYGADRPHAPASMDGALLQYDAVGNLERDHLGRQFTYDVNGRLVVALDAGNTLLAEFTYDSANGLVKRKNDISSTIYIDRLYEHDVTGNRAIKYIYAHQALIAAVTDPSPPVFGGVPAFVLTPENVNRLNLLLSTLLFVLLCAFGLRTSGSPGSLQPAYARRRAFVALLVSSVFVAPLFVPSVASAQPPPRMVFFHTDHLGSVTLVTDDAGNEVRRVDYRPYGEILETSGTFDNAYGFTGQLEDEALGLYYYQSRFYSSAMGRFVQPDSFIANGADPQGLNRYGYVNNNPVNLTDPTGHWFGWDDLIVAGIGFVVGFSLALIGGADFKTALVAGLASAVGSWLIYNTLGAGVLSLQLSSQVLATAANEVFAGSRGGAAGDVVQLVTTFAAAPLSSTVGLLVGSAFIAFTDRTWSNDFHYFDGALWFRDPFRGGEAMTTGAVIHYEDERIYGEVTIRHELLHRRQFGFAGDGFVPIYFAEIFIRMLTGQNMDDAYRAQFFEAEAFSGEGAVGFLGPGSAEEAFYNIRLFDQNTLVSAPGRF